MISPKNYGQMAWHVLLTTLDVLPPS